MTIFIHDKAKGDYRMLEKRYPKAYKKMMEHLRAIDNSQDLPINHCHVKCMRKPCSGWFRLAIYTPVSIRIIFRYLRVNNRGTWDEITAFAEIKKARGNNRVLQVVKIGFRSDVYNNLDRLVGFVKGKAWR